MVSRASASAVQVSEGFLPGGLQFPASVDPGENQCSLPAGVGFGDVQHMFYYSISLVSSQV